MFLNFQTQTDIRNEITETLDQLQRPASIGEMVKVIWSRCGIDGTIKDVRRTVNAEVRRMSDEGVLETVLYKNGQHYWQMNVLDRLASIPD